MKKIIKRAQPTELQRWRANNAAIPENFHYGCGNFPNSAVLKALLAEQGFLCAYTLLRVTSDNAHVEHLKPQSLCEFGEDVAWNNLVACFPEPGAQHPRYGALQKDKWWDEAQFISPLAANCEKRFQFKNDGSIQASLSTDSAAVITIKKLNLNYDRLKESRKNAIMKAGLHKKADNPIMSVKKAKSYAQTLTIKQSSCFTEFCTALEQVAYDYIKSLEKRALRKRYVSTPGER